MSADTPTLECAECDASVFASPSGRWSEDMPNQFCPSCGAELTIFVDDGGPGEAVASTRVAYQGSPSELRAEVERLTGELATLEFPGQHWKDEAFAHEQRAETAEAERDGYRAAVDIRNLEIREASAAWRLAERSMMGRGDRLAREVERLTAERDAHASTSELRLDMAHEHARTALDAEAEAARLRERVTAAESPQRAAAIIAAWLKLNGPMRERDGYAYAIGENLTAPEVRNGLGDDGWCFLAGDDNTVDVGDLDLSDIHGTPTGATPKTSMTGPEFAAAARASGVFTPGSVAEIRASIERHRGDPAKHVDAFFGTLSSDETTSGEPGGES